MTLKDKQQRSAKSEVRRDELKDALTQALRAARAALPVP